MTRGPEPTPDWWDDELDRLLKQFVAVFGEEAADETVIRVTRRCWSDIEVEDMPVREALVPLLVAAIKAEFRRWLAPH
jgi:hypothetical protein